jgi:hypothetical protein
MYLLSPEEATNYQSRSIEIASTLKDNQKRIKRNWQQGTQDEEKHRETGSRVHKMKKN